MEWNFCNKCKREFIIDCDDGNKDELCFQCWWENKVEKTEISLEIYWKIYGKVIDYWFWFWSRWICWNNKAGR